MAEYITKEQMIDYQQYLRGKMSNEENHKLWEYIKELPTADVVERSKIDKALDEAYKIRNEVLYANSCYEPNDVLDIIDQITKLFEEI